MRRQPTDQRIPSIVAPGLLLGVGLGGFVDGIVLHQLLQWHHLLSNSGADNLGLAAYPVDTIAGLEVNTVWDGVFHAASWFAVVLGTVLLWRRVASSARPYSHRSLLGLTLAGWGSFNLVEGIVDHHLLKIHHVRAEADVDSVLAWDLSFLLVGAALVGGGLVLHRRS